MLALLGFAMTVSMAVTFLIGLIFVCIVIALIGYVVDKMAPPEPVRWAVWGIVLIVILVGALKFFGVLT